MLPFDRDLSGMRRRTSIPSGGIISSRLPDYIRRIFDHNQMDFDFTFSQMSTLLSLNPQNVYTSFYYRKQTKNQWARDDPAFAVTEAFFVGVSALAYAILFCPFNLWSYLWSILYAITFDWFVVGAIVASTGCWLSNKYLRQYNMHSVEQEVEWLYCFDVHCNAFLCSFMLTYLFQYFALPLLMNHAILSCVLSNTLYAAAAVWYSYITHLGYRALPFLANTQVFLWYPVLFTAFMWLAAIFFIVFGYRFNLTRISIYMHFGGL